MMPAGVHGTKPSQARSQSTGVDYVEPVNVLVGVQSGDDTVSAYVGGQRQLH